jgi:DNA/RNA endonuclease YhcR with UshA esterase domain
MAMVNIMKFNTLRGSFVAGIFALVALGGAAGLRAQDDDRGKHSKESQKSVASKSVKFGTVAKSDKLYMSAIDVHDKNGAAKMLGQDGAFRGKVEQIYTPRTGSILILNFDENHKNALTAVLKQSDFSGFPDMSQLEGKQIVVSGKFSDFKGEPQIVLTEPKQISIVK